MNPLATKTKVPLLSSAGSSASLVLISCHVVLAEPPSTT